MKSTSVSQPSAEAAPAEAAVIASTISAEHDAADAAPTTTVEIVAQDPVMPEPGAEPASTISAESVVNVAPTMVSDAVEERAPLASVAPSQVDTSSVPAPAAQQVAVVAPETLAPAGSAAEASARIIVPGEDIIPAPDLARAPHRAGLASIESIAAADPQATSQIEFLAATPLFALKPMLKPAEKIARNVAPAGTSNELEPKLHAHSPIVLEPTVLEPVVTSERAAAAADQAPGYRRDIGARDGCDFGSCRRASRAHDGNAAACKANPEFGRRPCELRAERSGGQFSRLVRRGTRRQQAEHQQAQ